MRLQLSVIFNGAGSCCRSGAGRPAWRELLPSKTEEQHDYNTQKQIDLFNPRRPICDHGIHHRVNDLNE